MFWKRCLLVFALGVALCVLSPGAAAQTSNPCLAIATWWFPLSIPTGWSYYGPYPGTYTYLIWAWICPPVESPCPDCFTGGSPVSLSTGNTYIAQKDVRIPGLAGGLSLVRTWHSAWPASQSALQVGLFGPNWRSTYEEKMFVGSDNHIRYLRSDGSFWAFGYGGGVGSWSLSAPQNVSATLTTPNIATPYWAVTFQNGEQRRFDSTSGMLTSIIDRNGNTTTLTYDGSNRLVTVTDPASRHLYFGYGSPSSYLVTSVTSDVVGISLSYAYDGQNRLQQITNPDSTTISFGYDAQSRIISVTDMNGKVLESHTYDSNGRGLTSSRALRVEAVTFSYPNP